LSGEVSSAGFRFLSFVNRKQQNLCSETEEKWGTNCKASSLQICFIVCLVRFLQQVKFKFEGQTTQAGFRGLEFRVYKWKAAAKLMFRN
jgi:hypothetical protein